MRAHDRKLTRPPPWPFVGVPFERRACYPTFQTASKLRQFTRPTMNKKSMRRRPKNVLSLDVRMAVIRDYETRTKNARLLSKWYGCGRTQIQNIIKARKHLMALHKASKARMRETTKKPRTTNESIPDSILDSMAIVLSEWCQRRQAHDLHITETLLESAAMNIAPLLGVQGNQRPGKGWVKSITTKYHFSFNNPQSKASDDMGKSLKYIDIMDELGIKYNATPSQYSYDWDRNSSQGCPSSTLSLEESSGYGTEEPAEEKPLLTDGKVKGYEEPLSETSCPVKEVNSYREALNVLGPLERFALHKGNVRAVGLINQLENVFRNELEKILERGGID